MTIFRGGEEAQALERPNPAGGVPPGDGDGVTSLIWPVALYPGLVTPCARRADWPGAPG